MIQIQAFVMYIFTGIIIGIVFDLFRIIRKTFKISDKHTNIEDIVFGIISEIIIISVIFIISKGELRLYVLIALLFGFIIYNITISKYFIKINVMVLNFLKIILRYIYKIILVPIIPFKSFLNYVFKHYFTFIVINIKNFKKLIKK